MQALRLCEGVMGAGTDADADAESKGGGDSGSGGGRGSGYVFVRGSGGCHWALRSLLSLSAEMLKIDFQFAASAIRARRAVRIMETITARPQAGAGGHGRRGRHRHPFLNGRAQRVSQIHSTQSASHTWEWLVEAYHV